jgi:hypothetical protein
MLPQRGLHGSLEFAAFTARLSERNRSHGTLDVPAVISDRRRPGGVNLSTSLVRTMPDGSTQVVSRQEAIAKVLAEFYGMVQVMIGEAISVSELRAFIAKRKADLN